MAMTGDSRERTGSEEALRELRERYALATAAGGVGVWDRDLATGALYLDPALYALLGFAPAEIEAAALWPGRLHPEDLESARAKRRAALAPDAPRDPDGHTPLPEIECRVTHRDGGTRWLLVRGRVLRRADGTPYRLVGTATDITARKQAEAAQREAHEFRERILESAVTAIVAFDREGRFTLVNGRASELTGYAADELLGRTPDFLLPPGQRDAVMQALATTLRTGVPVARHRAELRRKDGAARVIHFGLAPLRAGDAIVGAVGTAEDVTEHRRASCWATRARSCAPCTSPTCS
jgi:PAS domain S-box-containing protein